MQNGKWNNDYFKLLLEKNWVELNENERKAEDMDAYMNADDINLKFDAQMVAII